MRLLYTIGIRFYTLCVRLAALFGHRNAARMVWGWSEWRSAILQLDRDRPVAWFHAASLGEFEQARPVLEAFRKAHPEYRVLLTFFSPSGYEVRKNYPLAEAVCYLPPDLPSNARKLLNATHPSVVLFVKYEFWFNYLGELRRRQIPTYIFSAIFRPGQYFFKGYGWWFRRQLGCFTHLFVQNEESLSLLRSHGFANCTLAGDTRFDRVHQIAEAAERDEVVERWMAAHEGAKIVVAGSSWPPDEEMLARYAAKHPDIRFIMAPHVIAEEHLAQIATLFPHSVRYSAVKDGAHLPDKELSEAGALVIDNIGLLSKLYRYATIAYIGGGFGVGIHNILEAVTFGKPVFFGPNYGKFKEAHDIIACGGGWCVGGADDLEGGAFHRLLTSPGDLDKASLACQDYMRDNLGSTDKILGAIEI